MASGGVRMIGKQPPSWLERILLGVLPERNRQSVSGDLLEEFDEQVRVRGSRLGASIWYARQILSFVPGWLGAQSGPSPSSSVTVQLHCVIRTVVRGDGSPSEAFGLRTGRSYPRHNRDPVWPDIRT
jgi:hypothetical protein